MRAISMSQGWRMKKILILGFLLPGLQPLSAQPLPSYDLSYYDSAKCIKEKANSFAKNTLAINADYFLCCCASSASLSHDSGPKDSGRLAFVCCPAGRGNDYFFGEASMGVNHPASPHFGPKSSSVRFADDSFLPVVTSQRCHRRCSELRACRITGQT
jgi:hypothetical protein